MAFIELRNLAKTFLPSRGMGAPVSGRGAVEALKPISLQIEAGRRLGIMGSNGAGKTTLLKMLAGLVLPTRGEARIGGIAVRHPRDAGALAGYVPADQPGLYERLTGRQNLLFFAALHGMRGDQARRRIDALKERLGIETLDRHFQECSTGMRQRLLIARALLHDPPLLLLDEPTRGLDPAHAARLREFLETRFAGGDSRTILFTSHHADETGALAHEVLILHRGEARAAGSLDTLCARKPLSQVYAEACGA